MSKKYDKEYKAAYYQRNKERMLAFQKKRYEADKENWKFLGRKRRLRKVYWPHLTIDEAYNEYTRLYNEQKGLCAICNNPETKIDPQLGKPCSLAVDHCHSTKIVRGLLCFRCNTNLGWFENMKNKFLIYLSKAA